MYPMLTKTYVKTHIPLAEKLNVSEVARSKDGFLPRFLNNQLDDQWLHTRENFIRRHLAQYRQNKTLRRRLALIMWAFDPELSELSKL